MLCYALSNNSTLQELCLDNNHIRDIDDLTNILENSNDTLKFLSLIYNYIDLQGFCLKS